MASGGDGIAPAKAAASLIDNSFLLDAFDAVDDDPTPVLGAPIRITNVLGCETLNAHREKECNKEPSPTSPGENEVRATLTSALGSVLKSEALKNDTSSVDQEEAGGGADGDRSSNDDGEVPAGTTGDARRMATQQAAAEGASSKAAGGRAGAATSTTVASTFTSRTAWSIAIPATVAARRSGDGRAAAGGSDAAATAARSVYAATELKNRGFARRSGRRRGVMGRDHHRKAARCGSAGSIAVAGGSARSRWSVKRGGVNVCDALKMKGVQVSVKANARWRSPRLLRRVGMAPPRVQAAGRNRWCRFLVRGPAAGRSALVQRLAPVPQAVLAPRRADEKQDDASAAAAAASSNAKDRDFRCQKSNVMLRPKDGEEQTVTNTTSKVDSNRWGWGVGEPDASASDEDMDSMSDYEEEDDDRLDSEVSELNFGEDEIDMQELEQDDNIDSPAEEEREEVVGDNPFLSRKSLVGNDREKSSAVPTNANGNAEGSEAGNSSASADGAAKQAAAPASASSFPTAGQNPFLASGENGASDDALKSAADTGSGSNFEGTPSDATLLKESPLLSENAKKTKGKELRIRRRSAPEKEAVADDAESVNLSSSEDLSDADSSSASISDWEQHLPDVKYESAPQGVPMLPPEAQALQGGQLQQEYTARVLRENLQPQRPHPQQPDYGPVARHPSAHGNWQDRNVYGAPANAYGQATQGAPAVGAPAPAGAPWASAHKYISGPEQHAPAPHPQQAQGAFLGAGEQAGPYGKKARAGKRGKGKGKYAAGFGEIAGPVGSIDKNNPKNGGATASAATSGARQRAPPVQEQQQHQQHMQSPPEQQSNNDRSPTLVPVPACVAESSSAAGGSNYGSKDSAQQQPHGINYVLQQSSNGPITATTMPATASGTNYNYAAQPEPAPAAPSEDTTYGACTITYGEDGRLIKMWPRWKCVAGQWVHRRRGKRSGKKEKEREMIRTLKSTAEANGERFVPPPRLHSRKKKRETRIAAAVERAAATKKEATSADPSGSALLAGGTTTSYVVPADASLSSSPTTEDPGQGGGWNAAGSSASAAARNAGTNTSESTSRKGFCDFDAGEWEEDADGKKAKMKSSSSPGAQCNNTLWPISGGSSATAALLQPWNVLLNTEEAKRDWAQKQLDASNEMEDDAAITPALITNPAGWGMAKKKAGGGAQAAGGAPKQKAWQDDHGRQCPDALRKRRKKDVDRVKNMDYYAEYGTIKGLREINGHLADEFPASPPATPDHKDLSMSKRFWKYQVEGWARRVRDYVKEFDIVEVTDSEGEADRGGNIDVEMSADSGGEAEANPGQTSSSGAAISNANGGSEAAMQLH
eukprot:g4032.t1